MLQLNFYQEKRNKESQNALVVFEDKIITVLALRKLGLLKAWIKAIVKELVQE